MGSVLEMKMSQRTTKPIMTSPTSEDSDQPARLRSRIRVIADRMCLMQQPGYPKRDKPELLPVLGRCTGWSESLLVTQVLL